MSSKDENQATTDSFDANIVPAETKARKEREGVNYKHTPDNSDNPDSIHTADGYTVDTEGLANNYAVEPPMYVDELGDMAQNALPLVEKFTIVDVFPTHLEAENAVSEIHKAGISKDKISILGKNYQDTELGHGSLNWKDIDASGGLAKFLMEMGILEEEARRYELEIEAGKFLAIAIGSNEDVIKTREILLSIGHRISDLQGKV